MEHLTHHFWLTDDGAILCKPCGATYRTSDAEVARFTLVGSQVFMERHRSCGLIGQVTQQQPKPVKVQFPYRVVPDPKRGPS